MQNLRWGNNVGEIATDVVVGSLGLIPLETGSTFRSPRLIGALTSAPPDNANSRVRLFVKPSRRRNPTSHGEKRRSGPLVECAEPEIRFLG